jgi:hypothetical protein
LTEKDKAEIVGTAQLQYTDAEKQVNLLARKLRDIGKEFEKLGSTLILAFVSLLALTDAISKRLRWRLRFKELRTGKHCLG